MTEFADKIDEEYSVQLLGCTYDNILEDWEEKFRATLLKNKKTSIQVLNDKLSKSSKLAKSTAFVEELFQKCFDKIPEIRLNLQAAFKEYFTIPKNVVLRDDSIQIENNLESVSNEEIDSLIAKLNEKRQSAIAYEKMTEVLLDYKQKQKNYIKKLSEKETELPKNEMTAFNTFNELSENFNSFYNMNI